MSNQRSKRSAPYSGRSSSHDSGRLDSSQRDASEREDALTRENATTSVINYTAEGDLNIPPRSTRSTTSTAQQKKKSKARPSSVVKPVASTSKRDASLREDAVPRYLTRSVVQDSTSTQATGSMDKGDDGDGDFQLADDQLRVSGDHSEDSNVEKAPGTIEEGPSYDFLATSQTPPSDHCMARSCFPVALNQTADQYTAMQERRRLRQIEADLLMGLLGTVNQDDVISVSDVREFTENRLSSYGVTKVMFNSTEESVLVETEGVVTVSDTISRSELPSSEETLLFNGRIAPCPVRRIGSEQYPIEWKTDVLQGSACSLCASGDSLYQFDCRHRKTNFKHQVAHRYTLAQSEESVSGKLVESTFTADVTLQSSNFERRHNFLPPAANMQEAVDIICEDDHIPSSQLMDDYQIILSGFQCLSSLSLLKLLRFYYCLVNSTYDIRGKLIRHVQMCRRDLPP